MSTTVFESVYVEKIRGNSNLNEVNSSKKAVQLEPRMRGSLSCHDIPNIFEKHKNEKTY